MPTTVAAGHATATPGALALTSRERVTLALVVGCLTLVYAPTVLWLFGRWTLSVWHHAHGLFIPPLVGWLVAQELKQTTHLPRTSSPWGFALIIPALALHALDTGMQTQLLSAISLVLVLPGLSLVLLGLERTRRIAFPLLFAVFALPIPLAVTERIHFALRHLTTDLVAPALSGLGVSLFVQGTTIFFANATVEIADACSGFSTLYAATAFSCLLAYYTSSTARRVLVLAMAAPIAIASNIARMILLLLLVVWQGPWVLDTFLHSLSGMLTFAVALPVLLRIGRDKPPSTRPQAPGSRPAVSRI